MYSYTSQLGFDVQAMPVNTTYNTDLLDTALADPNLDMYRRQSVDVSTHPNGTGLGLNYPYHAVSYLPSQPMAQLHAPIPLHLSQGLPQTGTSRQVTPMSNTCHPTPVSSQQLVHPPSHNDLGRAEMHGTSTAPHLLDYYAAAPQLLFPTPSELLTDLTATSAFGPNHQQQQARTQTLHQSESGAHVQAQSISPPQTSRQPTPEGPLNNAINKSESQRKARQRAVAEEIGFTPTDPDTISSHEKKRHYLECLEHYVLYLHEQLRLVQTPPLALERVSTYRGLSSRSIRTLLVHMQNTNKSLHEGTLAEEQVFLDMSAQVMAAHDAGLPLRRHSVDGGIFGHNVYPSKPSPDSPLTFNETGASATSSSTTGSPVSAQASTENLSESFAVPGAGGGM
ncbi:hypothetical protein HYDPIDRAFT_24663 [Hydnomerulius pinastri MD-312]|nr:hypothetical protein HYDPIDRAFT_24663 [Hydnomerulius pinastri MD-312]